MTGLAWVVIGKTFSVLLAAECLSYRALAPQEALAACNQTPEATRNSIEIVRLTDTDRRQATE
jgi:hypothetical protein